MSRFDKINEDYSIAIKYIGERKMDELSFMEKMSLVGAYADNMKENSWPDAISKIKNADYRKGISSRKIELLEIETECKKMAGDVINDSTSCVDYEKLYDVVYDMGASTCDENEFLIALGRLYAEAVITSLKTHIENDMWEVFYGDL